MAYMNQEKKAKIAAALKTVVPANWKYSLSVRHHSSIVMTITSAPVDLLAGNTGDYAALVQERRYMDVNHYYLDRQFSGELLETMRGILKALNLDNFDHSDSMTDYFHVGHYVDLNIGKWEKPFVVTGAKQPVAA